MTISEAMEQRHSVRQYNDKTIEAEKISAIEKLISECNSESGLNIQLVTNEPKAFESTMAHYGKFSGVTNYIAMIGEKSAGLDEKIGYYGEKLVLELQMMGLNSCWMAMTYSKTHGAFSITDKEKLVVVIPFGYGKNQGVPHKSKPIESLCKVSGDMPEWFKSGMKYAALAPTAMNQQKFSFSLDGNKVAAKAGLAFYSKVDLGIVKYHFELGAGKNNFTWA